MNIKCFMQFLIFNFCLIGCFVLGLFDIWFTLKFMNDLTCESLSYNPSFIICGLATILGITFALAVFVAIIRYIDDSEERKTAERNHRDTANAIKKILKEYEVPKDVIEKLTELKRRDVDFYKPEPPANPFKKTEKNE